MAIVLGVLGDLVEDIVVWLAEPLRGASDTHVSMFRMPGRSAANVARFAGGRQPTRFLGCVGTDAIGDSLITQLVDSGVEVQVQRRGQTGTVVVLVEPTGERSMLPDRAAALLLSDVEESWTADLTHLHVPGYSLTAGPIGTAAREVIARVHGQGGSVSIDTSSTGIIGQYGTDAFRQLLHECAPELLFANRAEADLLGLLERPLPNRGTAVVKDGPNPTTVVPAGGSWLRVEVPTVAGVLDLTGAGDAFAAGFLCSFLANADPHTATVAAHAMAAKVLRAPDASLGAG